MNPPAVPPAAARIPARAGAGAVLFVAWLAFAAPFLGGGHVPFSRDSATTFLPLRTLFAERLRHGELPRWVPWNGLGEPYLGQIVTATFHPQSLLFLVLDPITALAWSLLLAVLFAEIGAYRFARIAGASRGSAAAAGVAFGLSGYLVSMCDNPPYLVGLATLPWVGWAALRLARRPGMRHAAELAVWWALVFLGGDAQAFAGAGLLVLASWAAGERERKALAWAGAAAVAAGALVAVELVPALLVGEESARGAWVAGPELASEWALHPLRLVELVAPVRLSGALKAAYVAQVGSPNGLWSASVFAGGLALVAAAVSVRRKRAFAFFLGVAAFAILLALGEHAGLLRPLWQLVPVLARFRYPEKYLEPALAALVPAVGVGLDVLRADPRKGRITFGIAAALAAAAGLVFALHEPANVPGVGSVFARALFEETVFLALAAVCLHLAPNRPAFALALPALVIVEVLRANAGLVPPLPRAIFDAPHRLAELVRHEAEGQAGGMRLISAGKPLLLPPGSEGEAEDIATADELRLRPSVGASHKVRSFGVSLPGSTERYVRTFGTTAAGALSHGSLFAGCLLLEEDEGIPRGTVLGRNARFALRLVRLPCTARARWVRTRRAENLANALEMLPQATATEAVWEGADARELADGAISWVEDSPERLELHVEADRPAALFVADAMARGWTAAIDGTPATIHPTDVAGRGLEVPAGRHRVTMTYETPGFRTGALVSLGALLVVALGWVLGRRRSA